VLAGRLRPDVSQPHSLPLLPFAFVVFNQGEQFFVMLALVHAIKAPALVSHFLRGDFPEAFDFRKFLFAESAFHNEKAVDMAKGGMIIVDGGDKGNAVAEWRFDRVKRFPGEFPEIQVFAGVFFDRMTVDDEFVKDRATAYFVNYVIDVLLGERSIPAKERPGDPFPVNCLTMGDVAQMRFDPVFAPDVFDFHDCHCA
jgi:hypothetical protein